MAWKKIIGKVPPEKRWEMTAKSLTGALVAYSLTFLPIMGKEKLTEIESKMWAEVAKTAFLKTKETFNLPAEDAVDASNLAAVSGILGFGPEFKVEAIEKTKNRVVGRVTKCPFWERLKEFGATAQYDCVPGCAAWGTEALKMVNPKMTREIVKALPREDRYCEIVYELHE